jgi:RNA polymerase sigma factor (sigma-70 family)
MDDLQTDDLFRQLRSRDPREAWTRFLEAYSPLLFDVARRFERDHDAVADCYLFICEQLSENGFRRLRRFRPDGPARFSTWLYAVARNLCLDWHRREFGRHRVFESVARMPALDQEIFRGLFLERLPIEDLFIKLEPRYPGLTIEQVADRAGQVQQALGSRQRWLLAVRGARGAPPPADAAARDEAELLRIPSEMPNPETWAGFQEERVALVRAMSHLPPGERLLIRLRFARELTLAEIARLMGFENPQAADRRIRDVVEKLRREMAGKRPAGR